MANDADTKVKVIKGSYTHQMRCNLKLDKNRDESYSHHAVDAMLIGYSELGYEAYHKLQGEFIDFETGEILRKDMWDENMSDEVYADYLYGKKWANIRNEVVKAEKNVKYWHYVMRKSNRGLCNQTIRGTREYDGKQYKINKLDIRTKDGIKVFAKLAFSKKDSDRERLLVYLNDRRTFDDLCKIYEDYSDAANPFVQYEKDTGDIVRKYSKKHNGPRIDKLKYKDGEVGACIDISHKYGFEKGSKKVILESLVPYRMDVYYKEENHSYYLVGVKQSDIKFEKGRNVIDEEAYARILVNEKMIQPGQSRADLENLGFKFKLSFYKNDVIEYEKDGKIYIERLVSRTKPKQRNCIETKPIDRDKHENSKDGRKTIGLSKTKLVKKIRTDILGNKYSCSEEKFTGFC
jgi:CRISPR-associated endonuclease Csn1